jgi:hypothetical protein
MELKNVNIEARQQREARMFMSPEDFDRWLTTRHIRENFPQLISRLRTQEQARREAEEARYAQLRQGYEPEYSQQEITSGKISKQRHKQLLKQFYQKTSPTYIGQKTQIKFPYQTPLPYYGKEKTIYDVIRQYTIELCEDSNFFRCATTEQIDEMLARGFLTSFNGSNPIDLDDVYKVKEIENTTIGKWLRRGSKKMDTQFISLAVFRGELLSHAFCKGRIFLTLDLGELYDEGLVKIILPDNFVNAIFDNGTVSKSKDDPFYEPTNPIKVHNSSDKSKINIFLYPILSPNIAIEYIATPTTYYRGSRASTLMGSVTAANKVHEICLVANYIPLKYINMVIMNTEGHLVSVNLSENKGKTVEQISNELGLSLPKLQQQSKSLNTEIANQPKRKKPKLQQQSQRLSNQRKDDAGTSTQHELEGRRRLRSSVRKPPKK